MFRRGSLGAPVLAILLVTLAACGGNSPTATTGQQTTTGATTAATTAATAGVTTAATRPATASPARTATAATTTRTAVPAAATPTRATATATRAGTVAPVATATRGTATAARGTATVTRAGTATAARTGTAAGPWGPALAPLTDGQEYSDPEGRFSFSVPQEWTEVTPDDPDIEVAFAGGEDFPNMNVVLSSVPGNVDLETYNRAAETLLQRQIPEYNPVSVDRVTIDGQRAYKRIWQTTNGDGQRIQVQQVYFIEQGTAHVLSFGAPADTFDEYAETFDAIAGSYDVSP